MIDYITIRFDNGDEYEIMFDSSNNEWRCTLESGSSWPFLDQCVKAIYDDFNRVQSRQLRAISAEF